MGGWMDGGDANYRSRAAYTRARDEPGDQPACSNRVWGGPTSPTSRSARPSVGWMSRTDSARDLILLRLGGALGTLMVGEGRSWPGRARRTRRLCKSLSLAVFLAVPFPRKWHCRLSVTVAIMTGWLALPSCDRSTSGWWQTFMLVPSISKRRRNNYHYQAPRSLLG